MILSKLDEPVCEHSLIKEVLGTLDLILVLLLEIARLTIGIDADLEDLTFVSVQTC